MTKRIQGLIGYRLMILSLVLVIVTHFLGYKETWVGAVIMIICGVGCLLLGNALFYAIRKEAEQKIREIKEGL